MHLEDLYGGWDGLATASTRLVADVLLPLRAGGERVRAALRLACPAVARTAAARRAGGRSSSRASARARRSRAVRHTAASGSTCPTPALRAAMARDGELFARNWERWADQEDRYLAGTAAPSGPTSCCARRPRRRAASASSANTAASCTPARSTSNCAEPPPARSRRRRRPRTTRCSPPRRRFPDGRPAAPRTPSRRAAPTRACRDAFAARRRSDPVAELDAPVAQRRADDRDRTEQRRSSSPATSPKPSSRPAEPVLLAAGDVLASIGERVRAGTGIQRWTSGSEQAAATARRPVAPGPQRDLPSRAAREARECGGSINRCRRASASRRRRPASRRPRARM